MANTTGTVTSTLPSRDFHCKICDLYLDTVESYEVHVQYHKENLYVKWGTQSSQNDSENNNARVKTETTVSAPADSSDNMITKPSPDFQHRATPETSGQFGHPATPQSYHSAPSPYQNPDQTNFSPNTQFTQQFPQASFAQNQQGEQLTWEQPHYNSEYNSHKVQRYHPYNVPERLSQVSSSSPIYGQPLNQPTPSPSPNRCDKCGYVCDSAMQLTEHCNTRHPPITQGHFQQLHPFPVKSYSGFTNEPVKIKEEQEESSDILDLDSQKVVYQGNEEGTASSFEHQPAQARENNPRPVSSMVSWPEQKLYNSPSQINGESPIFKSEHKIFSDQKSYSPDHKMFSPDQKPYVDIKHYAQDSKPFMQVHHDPNQKGFLHHDQKMYPGVPLPSMTDYQSAPSTNPDMKPPYRPYDSSAISQISSTQASNPTSSAMPPITGKGANWKSNEARRPKTYNCTACNKWFTSSGHLKRHYNTTLHKNAVRSSGQPDPATLPISTHHHPSRDPNHSTRGPPPNVSDSNTQSPGIPGEDGRNMDDSSLPYGSQNYERVSRGGSMQSKGSYPHLQQGNLDNSFLGNNPLASHPLSHQVGAHSINISSQPPGIGNPIESTHQGLKNAGSNPSTPNPPNGEAGPSVIQNHLRGLLSVSTNNISTTAHPQTSQQLTTHTLPPFSHLAANPYSPRPTDHLPVTGPEPTHTALFLGQNFQQNLPQNYPNAMAPHVMDMAINNLPIANPVTFGEIIPENSGAMELDVLTGLTGPLPSFAQIQSQRFGIIVPNYLPTHNVGGISPGEDSTGQNFLVIDSDSGSLHEYRIAENVSEESADIITAYDMKGESNDIQIIKMDDLIDYANKENYESQAKSPDSPESAKVRYENNGSPSITSTVNGPPLVVSNKMPAESTGSPSITSTVPGPPLVESNKIPPKTAIHKCFECDKLFNKACYLTQHNKSFHSGAKPFKCSRCGKRFPDDASYEEHFSKHAGIKPFKCQLCPKSFNHKTDLRRHMCLHSGKKPFACHHCGKGFIRKDHMLKHCDTHLKKTFRQQC